MITDSKVNIVYFKKCLPNSTNSEQNQNNRLLMSVSGGPNDFFAGGHQRQLVSEQKFM